MSSLGAASFPTPGYFWLIAGALAGYALMMWTNPVSACFRDGWRAVRRYPRIWLVLGGLGFGNAMFDLAMRYVAASERWVEEYGRGYTDLIGKSHYEINPDVPERWKEIHQRALAGAIESGRWRRYVVL